MNTRPRASYHAIKSKIGYIYEAVRYLNILPYSCAPRSGTSAREILLFKTMISIVELWFGIEQAYRYRSKTLDVTIPRRGFSSGQLQASEALEK